MTSGAAPDGGPIAVVDIGSGSVKLLIQGGRDGDVRDARKTRLMAGGGGRLPAEALAATGEAFAEFARIIEEQIPGGPAPDRLAVVATAAVREADNRSELTALSLASFGIEPTVLDGEREAALTFRGAMAGRTQTGRAVVLDIGAGSTELAFRGDDRPADGGPSGAISLPIGGRNLTDQYLAGDPPRPDELSSALSVVELYIDDVRRELPAVQSAVDGGLVIAAGAMTQIARVEIGLVDRSVSVHDEVITKVGLEELFRALATESAEDRGHNPGLAPEHVDDIVGAMCILIEFCRQLDIDEVTVSERDLSHGLAAELATASAGGAR
ncbi:MAG: hypothetical protein AAF547_20740 [Actinomycetota bacterium]